MKSAFIIKDKTGKPYAVVALLAGGTEFYPLVESSTTWASWMKDEYAARTITKQQLSETLDNSMDVEGPVIANRANKAKIDELIAKAKKTQEVEPIESAKEQKSAELVPVISLMDARLDYLENSEWRNAVQFKAKSFIADVNKSTFAYEVKRTRAVFDDSLAIPGTDRRGGWRCPPGTRFGGQITDRFGRNCGWGVSRRLANEISDLGERMENVGDKRRERRVARRNERVGRRLAQGGRIERAARRVGDALDVTNRPGGDTIDSPKPRGAGLLERVAGRVGNALDSDNNGGTRRPRRNRGGGFIEGFLEGWNGEDTLPEGTPNTRKPKAPQARPAAPRKPKAPKAPKARPARPRQPRAPRQPANNPYVENLRTLDDRAVEEQWLAAQAGVDALRDAVDTPRGDGRIGMMPIESRRQIAQSRLDAVNAELKRRGIRPPLAEYNARNNPNPPRPRRPRQIQVDNVSKTPVPAGAPRAAETLEEYKTRKYNEHQQRVREIREAGGNAGLLRRSEWDRFHGPAVEDNWNRAQQRNGGRGARRAATDAGAARTATRRPKPADAPDANQPARRQRKPFNAPNQRGLNSEAAARRKRTQMEGENGGAVRYALVEHNGKYYVVDNEEVRRANAAGGNLNVVNEGPRPPVRPAAPAAPRRPATPRSGRTKREVGEGFLRKENDAKVGQIGVDGLPSGGRIEVGNAGINTKDDAVNHLANGGDIADIPDDFVIEAIKGNTGAGKRYSHRQIAGGVNGAMNIYTDSRTGKQYCVKYEGRRYAYNEDVNEIVGNNIAGRLGFPVGEFRFAGPVFTDGRGQGRPIIFEHADNYAKGVQVRRPTQDEMNKMKTEDKIAATMLDYLILNTDRHNGNFFIAQDGREVRFVPIDPSLGFNARSFNGHLGSEAGFREWLSSSSGGGRQGQNGMLQTLRQDVASGKVTRASAIRAIQQLQENLRASEAEKPFAVFADEVENAAGTPSAPRNIVRGAQTSAPGNRIDYILDTDASTLARIILG